MKKTTHTTVKRKIPEDELTISKFIALPDSEKERIYREIDSMTPDEMYAASRPLNAQERAQWKRIQKNIRRGRGRPKVGKGVARVSLSVEKSLLSSADAYARRHKLNRSELVSQCLVTFLGLH